MGVYVDSIRDWGWILGPSCHLVADSNEELHEFAARIGMKREWFQAKMSGPHYDLVASKRKRAVRMGAIELETRVFAEKLREWRRNAAAMVQAAKTEEGQRQVREFLLR